MTFDELQRRWETRRGEGERLGAIVPLATIATEVLADLTALHETESSESLSLSDAAKESNYHVDSLSRMIRENRLRNVGTRRRPRVLRGELPRKPAPEKAKAGSSTTIDAIARQALSGRVNR